MNQNPFDSYDEAYKASLNNAYRNAEVKRYNNYMIPEGKYQCVIISFALKPSKQFIDELNLNLGFEILEGPCKGANLYKFYPITPEQIERLKTDMKTLDIDLGDDVTKLGDYTIAQQILDKVVDVTVKHHKKTKGDGFYQNVYINRCVGKMDMTPVENDDDCPFE